MNKIEEYQKLVQAQKQYREDSIASLKSDIGRSLHAEFEDFYETINTPMNEMLGEIYREKIAKIAKILADYDIEVQEVRVYENFYMQ